MSNQKISDATIKRLPIYLRLLERERFAGKHKTNSNEIAKKLDLTPASVRKDLSLFGDFGHKGVGYNIDSLISKIEEILNLNHFIPVCIVGVGRLGEAIVYHNHFMNRKINIVAAFDKNPDKVGKEIDQIVVQHLDELGEAIKTRQFKIGIICVPPNSAQNVADKMIENGIKNILNFSPVTILVPEDVRVRHTDFGADLHSLAYYLPKEK